MNEKKSINNPSIADLINDLGNDDYLTRQRARLLLVKRENESVPSLLKALKSQDVHVRLESVQTLGEIRDPETAPALTEMLMDEDIGVRWAGMESLIHMGRDSIRPLLEKFVKKFSSSWMREGTLHILRVLKDRHELNDLEIVLFEKLDEQIIPGIEPVWNSEQVWAAEKALEALD
jgi:HEAT repeat protein